MYLARDTVDSLQLLKILRDPICRRNKNIDLYLISPNANYPPILLWQNVALSLPHTPRPHVLRVSFG